MFVQKAYAAITPPSNINSIADVINRVLPIVYGVAGVALFGYLIYAGFTWLLSSGDPDKLRKAQDTMLNAVIGLGIILLAYFGTRVIGGILGLPLLT
ncbi:MAG: hypothetical protein ABIC57_02845 [bacterium]